MSKEILLVYQDCYNCDANKSWYERAVKIAQDGGLNIVPTPHNMLGVKGIILKAAAKGCEKLPFFTDGKKFSYDIAKFVEKSDKKATKKLEVKDEAIPEKK